MGKESVCVGLRIREGDSRMKMKVVLGKTMSDNVSVAWTDIKTIVVDVPDGYHIIGEQEITDDSGQAANK